MRRTWSNGKKKISDTRLNEQENKKVKKLLCCMMAAGSLCLTLAGCGASVSAEEQEGKWDELSADAQGLGWINLSKQQL